MDRFSLACIKLFNKFPLHQYTTSTGQEEQQLNILLLGRGDKLDTLLYQVLTNGQMPHTALNVTVVSDIAAEMADRFVKNAPAAPQFIRITRDGTPVTNDPTTVLCTLHFRQEAFSDERISIFASGSRGYAYVLISSGDDSFDQKLASACAAFSGENARLVARVQSHAGVPGDEENPFLQVHSFGSEKNDAYYAETKRLAFNLHYIYEKSADSRKPLPQIEKSFSDPYNCLSNMEAATHIRTKLACCGIDSTNLNAAAQDLNCLLREDPSLLDRLSAVEHNRWLMTKLLQGYRPMPSVDLIYSAPGVGTHDSSEKWHCCIVPCDMTGKSRLEPPDWDRPFSVCREELDPLDRVTLQIHEACKRISDQNRVIIEGMLQTLTLMLTLEAGYSEDTLACKKRIEIAVSQLWAEKKSVIPLFERELQALREQLKRDAPPSFLVQSTLDQIEQALAPLIEYVSRKDYKELDRILVGQLPYALTRKPDLVLAKPVSETLSENIYAAWQLDPKQVVYFAIARSEADLPRLCSHADRIQNFLEKYCPGTQALFHLIIPQSLAAEQRRLAQSSHYQLHTADETSLAGIQKILVQIASALTIDAFDMTGSDPLLAHAVNLYASRSRIGVFYIQNGTFYNLQNAETFEYERPHKALTVCEMFDMAGAVYQKSETEQLTGLAAKYPVLWKIAQGSSSWHSFCKEISAEHSKKKDFFHIFKPSKDYHPDIPISASGSPAAVSALLPALRRLEERGYVRGVAFTRIPGGRCEIRFILPENIGEGAMLTNTLQNALRNYQSDMVFYVEENKEYPKLVNTNLTVREYVPLSSNAEEYDKLLLQLEQENIITNHRRDPVKGHTFSFASAEVLTCLQKSGTILERLIYFSALLDGDFDDVETGWEFFHHTGPDSSKNEIDVICTKGLRSLFVSAKMIAEEQYKSKEREVLYEILLHAQKFGINAAPVIVASSVNQFEERDGKTVLSGYARKALYRGIYLLGRECIDNGTIGQMLTCIMDGRYEQCLPRERPVIPVAEPVKPEESAGTEEESAEIVPPTAETAVPVESAGWLEPAEPAVLAEPAAPTEAAAPVGSVTLAEAGEEVVPTEPAISGVEKVLAALATAKFVRPETGMDEPISFAEEIFCGKEKDDASEQTPGPEEDVSGKYTIHADDWDRDFTEDKSSTEGPDAAVGQDIVVGQDTAGQNAAAGQDAADGLNIFIDQNVAVGSGRFLIDGVILLGYVGTEQKVVIPDGIMEINAVTFANCRKMREITIPDSVVLIGNSAFAFCDSLVVVHYSGTEEQWNAILIEGGNECLTSARIQFAGRSAGNAQEDSGKPDPASRPAARQSVRVTKIGRNDPCPCGSGLKWKKCICKEYHEQ